MIGRFLEPGGVEFGDPLSNPDRFGDAEAPVPSIMIWTSGPTASRTAAMMSIESLRSCGVIVRQAAPNGSNLSAL